MEHGATNRNLELTEADLLGHTPEELRCNQCGGSFCGLRTGRVLNANRSSCARAKTR